MNYSDHLARKAKTAPVAGFTWTLREDSPAFDFQRSTVEWALKLGRSAIFADTGLGKTLMQLEWAHAVVSKTGGRVLILTPLAVGPQTEREARKFGIPGAKFVRDDQGDPITIVNYESLHKFDPSAFVGVVLDESSILKSYMGATKQALISAFEETPYRLACTATPAPNDYLELGNHSEFLGVMSSHRMIARWFISDQSAMGTYRLKGHARRHFWDWVASWSRCIGTPSDVGPHYDDGPYKLPELVKVPHMVSVDITDDRGDGELFRKVALSATDIHREKRRSAPLRAAKVAELVLREPEEPWLIWCETNYEADALREVLPRAVEVRGNTKTEEKERLLLGFDEGGYLITKPKIAGFGLNWQHCARIAFVGGSYSYEAFYQAVRRCWRFGQKRPVKVHVVMGKTESALWQVVTRKAEAHEEMKTEMFAASRRACARAASVIDYHPNHQARLPAWL
jgi:superfamily II DNA or RNA helicase